MLRIVLLLSGCMLLLFQQYIIPFTNSTQFIIFLSGIILLGVPHGAADLLVATQNANSSKKSFSKFRFLAVYISRLFAFAAILWLFPLAGNLLFILGEIIVLIGLTCTTSSLSWYLKNDFREDILRLMDFASIPRSFKLASQVRM